jgi:hypothetical protein
VPQWPSSPFLFHAMKQGKEKTPPGAAEMDRPAPHGLPEQHAGQKWPRANEASLGVKRTSPEGSLSHGI